MKAANQMVVLCLVLAAASCKRTPEPEFPIPRAEAAELKPTVATALPAAVENAVRKKGQAIAAQAFGVLSSRLGKAIADAGLTNAIQFCSVHGITLTTAVGVTNEVVLRRVTHRPRNTQNRADTNELELIRYFESELNKGATPQPAIGTNRTGFYTYYAPIVLTLPLCLNCHGQPGQDIQPEVLTQLKATYPADDATGFKLGQLRGLWSVDFKQSDFKVSPRK